MGDNTGVAKTFRSLVESADRKFVRVREIPLYGHRVPHHYYRKVFKAYTKLWKFQQLNRSKLVESGLQRWEIGEIASRIGQLYYAQYMRTSETRFLLEAYVFYEAILNRGYFEGTKGGIGGGTGSSSFLKNPNLLFKELRFYARFLVVSLVLNRTEMVKILAERFRNLVDDSKATFRDTNFKEWKLVVQEIVRFLKVDTDFMHIKPLRYCATFDSHPDSLPYVARFHAKRVLKLHDAVLTSYHRNEVKFTELTLDTFRMLQCLEWEPSGTFFQMRTTESNNHVNSNDQSGPSGLIDINLAADMTDPALPSNPRKAILYRPSATELVAVIATICEELPAESILLLYISASGKAGSKLTSRMETSGSLRNSSNLKVDSQSFRECDRSRPLAPIHDKGDFADSFADSLWLGPKGRGSNDLYPGDIIPFTRRPLFLIVDSDNSRAFKVVHGAELGETAALLLSPRRPAFWSPSSTAERTKNGSQFTFFLTAPLQAFCQLVGLSVSDTDKDVYNKADMIISSTLSEWEVRLCTSNCLNLVWAQVLSDPFIRRLILRFIFCRAVLSLFCLPEDGDAYLPECLPELPEYVSPNSDAVQSNVLRLAESLGVVNRFHFDKSL